MSSQVPATNFVSKYILNILFLNILFLNIKVVQILLSIVHDHPVHNLFDIITLKIITFYKTTKEEIDLDLQSTSHRLTANIRCTINCQSHSVVHKQ